VVVISEEGTIKGEGGEGEETTRKTLMKMRMRMMMKRKKQNKMNLGFLTKLTNLRFSGFMADLLIKNSN